MYTKTKFPVLFLNAAIIFSANQACADTNSATAQEVPQTVAIGSYLNSDGGTVPLAYYNGGIDWKLSSPLPLPTNVLQSPGQQNSFLNGAACFKNSGACTSVGAFITNSHGYAPLIYVSTDRGAHWSLSANLPLPDDLSTPAESVQTALLGVACSASEVSNCSTVGYYTNSSGATVPLSYTSSDGQNWTLSETFPMPADAMMPENKQRSILYGISCDGQTCTAVGSYTNTNKSIAPLSYTSTNGGQSWTLSQASLPLPADVPNNNQMSELRSIVCNSTDICSAVGYYYNNKTGVSPLSYISSNGGVSWQLSSTLPLPSDVIGQTFRQKTYLNGIYCSKTGLNCSAVGYYTNKSGTVSTLSYTSDNAGSSWSVSTSPLPLPADSATGFLSNSGLFSILCDSSKNICNSVGYYRKAGDVGIAPLSYVSTDGGITWDVNPIDLNLPADAAQENQLSRLNGVN